MAILSEHIGEKLAGVQLARGSTSRPSIAWIQDEDTGFYHRGVQGEVGFVSNGVETAVFGADGLILPLLNAGRVVITNATGGLTDDAGLAYNATTDVLTVAGGLVVPAIGPAAAQQHTLPAVASDTVTLNAAAQTLTNKTIALGSNTISGTIAQFNTAVTDQDLATLAGAETLTNKSLALGSNTLTGTTAQFNTALTDNDFATLAGTETLTNKTLTTPVISGAAPATPTANVLYTDTLVKGWVETSGSGAWTIDKDFNVSSITDDATGRCTLNWATALPDTDYGATGQTLGDVDVHTLTFVMIDTSIKSTTALSIAVSNILGSFVDPGVGISIWVI